ncbi:RecT family recombinase [Brucella sp. TWI432]
MSNLMTVEDAGGFLEQIRVDVEPLIIDSGKSFDRLKAVFHIAVQQEPKILQCTLESLRRELMKCAADGLVPDAKEAVLLPYYDNKEKVMLANYQPMVHGIIKRMKELGDVFTIVCNLVHANDEFVLDEADPDSMSHKSDRFSKDRGAIVGGYVIFRDGQKRLMHFETMSMEDFEKVRKASKAPDSPAWRNWPNEMYRKAVLRRGAKYITINNDKIRALIERQDDMFDFSQPKVAERVNPFGGVIEHDQTKAISNHSQAAMPMDTGSHTDNEKEKVEYQQGKQENKPAQQTKQSSDQAQTQAKAKAKADLPDVMPTVPDVLIQAEHKDMIVEGCTKILAISLDQTIDAADRRVTLKQASGNWKGTFPEYAHGLLKACIDASDWSIRKDAKGEPWTADHAAFVHKVKTLLSVEKLNVGKYP